MTLRTRIISAACIAGALLAVLPEPAEAQRRAAVRVGVGAGVRGRPRATVVVSRGRYRPYYYGAYGLGAWGYDSWYYPAYAYAQWPPYYGGYRYDDSASLRLQVNPRQTEVFVDGYFAGTVDDFDGVLQRLHIEAGDHDIELYLPGHKSHTQRVYMQPHKTFRIRHDMRPLSAGDPEPVRPVGEPLPRREDRDDSEVRSGDFEARREPPPGRSDRDREPPPSRSRAADTRFGSLALRVQPGDAEVMIDGETWQSTPDERLVVELSAGPHRIEIRKDGYRTYMTEITVRPGQTAPLNVAMTKVEK